VWLLSESCGIYIDQYHLYKNMQPNCFAGNNKAWPKGLRPSQNASFCSISASGSNFNPQNTQCIPVVKIFAFLVIEQN